ncbi:M14 family zinc carboxypeptidase [Wenyingzhuangia fucanilytica]|nr:M14 family zinc carboxypeptidase [Wenyingzhuangia fucanilytica]
MNRLDLDTLEKWYLNNYEDKLLGRRIVLEDIEPIINSLKSPFAVKQLGTSEEDRNIYHITLGTGPKKILLWSQMHGNESTGTKALFDLFKYVEDHLDNDLIKDLLKTCTLIFIPMLNPDGSTNFTRVNANDIDLNRDAVDLKAKESNLLRDVLNNFNPHFCFNLHDQRTIFNVEGFKNPATISFLAPSVDEERTLTNGRKETMAAIVAMNATLQETIPNYVGRYTDEFYPTATGDNFQKLGHNTILIEAGHYPGDYNRNIVRKYNFYAILSGLKYLVYHNDYTNFEPYFDIPNNGKQNYDFIFRNVIDDQNNQVDIAFQYEYEVVNNELVSKLVEYQRGDLKEFNAYNEF